jgi:hypothetical protein
MNFNDQSLSGTHIGNIIVKKLTYPVKYSMDFSGFHGYTGNKPESYIFLHIQSEAGLPVEGYCLFENV